MIRTHRIKNLRARGFTLIELVVVVAILVVLSGLVLPKLDLFKLKANKGVAAANMAGVDRYVESYRIQRDLYPDRFDSLIDATSLTTLYPQLDPQCLGPAPTPNKLTTTTIATADELRSLTRVGLTTVMDHQAGGLPSNSGTVSRTLAVGDTLATINVADPDGQNIMKFFYPPSGVVPAGKKVVVFGVGPLNKMMGDVLHAAPFYANSDQTAYYTRFLTAFEVSTTGGRARFLSTIGSDGDLLTEEVEDYYGL